MLPIQLIPFPLTHHCGNRRLQSLRFRRFGAGLWWGISLTVTLALGSCSSSMPNKSQSRAGNPAMTAAVPAAPAVVPVSGEENATASKEASGKDALGNKPPQSRPQLIKSAQITLQVKSIEETMKNVNLLVQKYQGDILELQDWRSGSDEIYQSISIKLRVPQERLDVILEAMAQLGTVRNRAIKAEDVSTQLVDLQARLKNLRQTETQLQNILQQTGSVGDVLKVTQELSRVRESIEQLDATVTNLKNQVAYSTVELRLSDTVVKPTPQRDLGSQVQDTWQSATNAVSGFSVGLLKLSVWLLVFAPYWLVPLGVLLYWRSRRRKAQLNSPPKEPDLDIIEM